MNARKVFLIVGGIAVLLMLAVVALAVFYHSKMEKERNQARTQRARDARWNRPESKTENETRAEVPQPEEELTKQTYADAAMVDDGN